MRKEMFKLANVLFVITIAFGISSCQQENSISKELDQDKLVVENNVPDIDTLFQEDLETIKSNLIEAGVDPSAFVFEEQTNEQNTKTLASVFIRVVKVTCKSPNPNQDGTYIDNSGVLLVPRFHTNLFPPRILVAIPGTKTDNNASATIAFRKLTIRTEKDILNTSLAYALQVVNGYVVLVPDHPGFGDSNGQCFHPYLDREALTNSTIDLIKAARLKLTKEKFKFKENIVVAGYSQGAFVAAALARELETNPIHDIKISGLIIGGTPCNLKEIADVIRNPETKLNDTFYLPYAFWGYKMNRYPQIEMNSILLEPYASTSYTLFDGTKSPNYINNIFSKDITKVYTNDFIYNLDTNDNLALVNNILRENSIHPWKNKCKFVMTHGIDDTSVYYKNAYDFANEQNKSGGTVTFTKTEGTHGLAMIPYLKILNKNLNKLK